MGKVRKRALGSVFQRYFSGLKKTGAWQATLFGAIGLNAHSHMGIARVPSGKRRFPPPLRGFEQTAISAIERSL